MRIYIGIFIFLLGLVGCTNLAEPSPTPQESAAGAMADTAVPPTETPVPTATMTATAVPTNTSTPVPTDTPTPMPTATAVPDVPRFPVRGHFNIYGEQPAVPNDNIGPSGTQFTDPGSTVYYDGQFHMFHNAFTGWPAPVDVMYSVSDDGIHWTLGQEEPVFTGNDLPFVGVAALASSVLVLDDGTWVMYFYTWDDSTWPVSASSIGIATAPSPFGPWTARNRPVLTPGDTGEWDDLAVRAPSVLATDEGYIMFYAGYQRGSASIGQAFSDDGVTWTKYDDPTTAEAPYAESDPTFSGIGNSWDKLYVYQPRVRQTVDGWVMLYTASNQVSNSSLSQGHGLAFSVAGTEWTRSATTIFLPGEVQSNGLNIWYTELEYALDTYYIFFELGTGGETEIYVATFDSSLLSE